MNPNWIRFLVPRAWTPEQALAAVGALQQAIDAVWAVHGDEMASALGELGPDSLTGLDVLREDPLDTQDDIPF